MTRPSSPPVFLLTGFASEYSLELLARVLRNEGEVVFETDFSISGVPELGEAEVVLITSQHPARTSQQFRLSYGSAPPYDRYLSPMECMRRFKVCCSVLVPHDLEQPLISDEIAYLSFFDYYCSPYESNPGLSRLCQPIYVGWIRYTGPGESEFEHLDLVAKNGVFMVNQLIRLIDRGGAACLLSEFSAVFDRGIPCKLPRWPGVSVLEQELKSAGVKVIPAEVSATQVIANSAAVLCNAPGSVFAEAAYLGVPVSVVAPGGNEIYALKTRQVRGKPFDFQLLIRTIRNHLQQGVIR